MIDSLIDKMALANILASFLCFFFLKKWRPYGAHKLASCLRFREMLGTFMRAMP